MLLLCGAHPVRGIVGWLSAAADARCTVTRKLETAACLLTAAADIQEIVTELPGMAACRMGIAGHVLVIVTTLLSIGIEPLRPAADRLEKGVSMLAITGKKPVVAAGNPGPAGGHPGLVILIPARGGG